MTDLTPPESGSLTKRVGTMRIENHRYRDNERTWQRTSTMLKQLQTSADSFGLDAWKQRQVALGMAQRPDLVLGVAAAAQFGDDGKLTDDAKSTINGLCKQAMDAAKSKAGSNSGSAVHTATERLDLGESISEIGLPAPYSGDLLAYENLKIGMRLSFNARHIERSVRNTELDTVGTYDRLGWSGLLEELGYLAPGEQLVVDVKTEERPELNLMKITAQMADYAYADGQWVPEPTIDNPYAGHYEPMPNVSKAIGLIIHLRGARAVPILVDLTKGIEACRAAAAQRDRSREAKLSLGEPGAWAFPLNVPLPPAATVTQSAVAQGPNGYAAPRPEPAYVPTGHECNNCAPLLGRASSTRVDGTEFGTLCTTCGGVDERSAAGSRYAVGDTVTVAGIPFTKHSEFPEAAQVASEVETLRGQLIEAIGQAADLTALASLYEIAQASGVRWDGKVAIAGTARQRIVQCKQRAMHDPATTGKCACGWERGMAP